MGPPLLEALLAHDHEQVEQIGGFSVPENLVLRPERYKCD